MICSTLKQMNSLVQFLIATGKLKTSSIIEAFLIVDRIDFVLPTYQNLAYKDIPLPIGYEQTISQPSTVAFMLELLQPKNGEKILDVGSGSGWTTALLSYIVGEKGSVIGTEIIPELAEFGQNNIKKFNLTQTKIIMVTEELGHREEGPYDKILVSASATELPKELLDQLKNGGRLVIPIGESICEISKDRAGRIETKRYEGFVFVPLIYGENHKHGPAY